MKTINSIRFTQTKGGHLAAIINNELSVVRNPEKEPAYCMYHNISKGIDIEATPELIEEFTTQFHIIEKRNEDEREEKKQAAVEAERKRIQDLEDFVKGMTPQDFGEAFNLKSVETASHWSDLYEGRSSFALIVSSDKELEALEIAIRVNAWTGDYVELCNRAGEHHHTFNSVYDLKYYRRNVESYFNEKYFLRTRENEEEYFLDRVKEAESMEEISDIVSEFKNMEEGYYSTCGSLVYEGVTFENLWGYYYDVYSYSFGFKFSSKDIYYNGVEAEEEEEEETEE